MNHAVAVLCALLTSSVAVAQFDALIEPWSGSDGPGGAFGIIDHRAGTVQLHVFGMADLAADRPNTEHTPFYLASVAKPIVATAVLAAVETGRLDIDGPIATVFPEIPPRFGDVTFRHLLDHRSGLPDIYEFTIACDLGPEPLASNAAGLELLMQMPGPVFPPGERFLYSNSGYLLLAEALRRTTGKDLPVLVRSHVFDAYLTDDVSKEAAAISYRREGSTWSPMEIGTGLQGPGGLAVSIEDLAHMERAWVSGTLPPPPAPVDGWHHARIGPYAAGWMHQRVGAHPVIRHYGGAFGFSADVLRFPDDGFSVVAVSNAADLDARELAEHAARIHLGDRFRPRAAPDSVDLTTDERARFGRIWRERQSGHVWALTDRRDHFVLASLGDVRVNVVPVAANRLAAIDSQLPFEVELVGDDTLVIHRHDGSTSPLERLPFPPVNAADAAEVAGTYVNVDLGANVVLEPTPRGMVRMVQHDPLLELTPFIPLTRDILICDRGAQIELRRDDTGRIVGFVMTTNRVWNLPFERSARR